jgi:hypothetical protein
MRNAGRVTFVAYNIVCMQQDGMSHAFAYVRIHGKHCAAFR